MVEAKGGLKQAVGETTPPLDYLGELAVQQEYVFSAPNMTLAQFQASFDVQGLTKMALKDKIFEAFSDQNERKKFARQLVKALIISGAQYHPDHDPLKVQDISFGSISNTMGMTDLLTAAAALLGLEETTPAASFAMRMKQGSQFRRRSRSRSTEARPSKRRRTTTEDIDEAPKEE